MMRVATLGESDRARGDVESGHIKACVCQRGDVVSRTAANDQHAARERTLGDFSQQRW